MSPIRIFFLASAAALVGACSDTQRTTGPTESSPNLREEAIIKSLGSSIELKSAAQAGGIEALHSPLLCNFGGTGPECLRVFHSGTFVDRVYHRGRAQGTGCSRSIIRIAGILRGRSRFICHRRGDLLIANWSVRESHPFGTRIQVDWTGAGAASPTGFVYTNYR